MSETEKASVRQDIAGCLSGLMEELGHYPQTTHGRLGGFSIEEVAGELVRCYNDPRAFTVSSLSQSIEGFTKEYMAKASR